MSDTLNQDQPQGILLIDKPTGITSHDVVDQVRRLTGVRRVGHAGTLDPLATGLLIILVGRAYTKRQSEFLKQDKEYLCTAELGKISDSYDLDGQLEVSADWSELSKLTKADLEKSLAQFRGQIEQQVPAFSAVKVKGKKLYEQARKGQLEGRELPVRQVVVHSLELEKFDKNENKQTIVFAIRVNCSSGTYIRSLIHDIGQSLKVGAVVTSLRRTKIGTLSVDDAVILKHAQITDLHSI